MRKYLAAFVLISSLSLAAQTATKNASATTPKKPAAAAPSHPTAIIDTTAGTLTCTLFPDKAPIGVANFIGLAKGTKDWTSPATGRKMHGVPLYSGTIFHRVIPEFMIQGGDPMGSGMGDPGYKFKNETSPDLTFDQIARMPRNGNDRPNNPPKINKITIAGTGAAAPVHHAPVHRPAPKAPLKLAPAQK